MNAEKQRETSRFKAKWGGGVFEPAQKKVCRKGIREKEPGPRRDIAPFTWKGESY